MDKHTPQLIKRTHGYFITYGVALVRLDSVMGVAPNKHDPKRLEVMGPAGVLFTIDAAHADELRAFLLGPQRHGQSLDDLNDQPPQEELPEFKSVVGLDAPVSDLAAFDQALKDPTADPARKAPPTPATTKKDDKKGNASP